MPELVSVAFRKAWGNRPGPVYLDLPGDVLHERVDEANVQFPVNSRTDARILGDPDEVKRAIEMLAKAEKPLVLSGTGVMWSRASQEIQDFVDATGIPVLHHSPVSGRNSRGTTKCPSPQARSMAFREADVALVVGTRINWIWQYLQAPRFRADLKTIQVNTDREEIGHNKAADVGIRSEMPRWCCDS